MVHAATAQKKAPDTKADPIFTEKDPYGTTSEHHAEAFLRIAQTGDHPDLKSLPAANNKVHPEEATIKGVPSVTKALYMSADGSKAIVLREVKGTKKELRVLIIDTSKTNPQERTQEISLEKALTDGLISGLDKDGTLVSPSVAMKSGGNLFQVPKEFTTWKPIERVYETAKEPKKVLGVIAKADTEFRRASAAVAPPAAVILREGEQERSKVRKERLEEKPKEAIQAASPPVLPKEKEKGGFFGSLGKIFGGGKTPEQKQQEADAKAKEKTARDERKNQEQAAKRQAETDKQRREAEEKARRISSSTPPVSAPGIEGNQAKLSKQDQAIAGLQIGHVTTLKGERTIENQVREFDSIGKVSEKGFAYHLKGTHKDLYRSPEGDFYVKNKDGILEKAKREVFDIRRGGQVKSSGEVVVVGKYPAQRFFDGKDELEKVKDETKLPRFAIDPDKSLNVRGRVVLTVTEAGIFGGYDPNYRKGIFKGVPIAGSIEGNISDRVDQVRDALKKNPGEKPPEETLPPKLVSIR